MLKRFFIGPFTGMLAAAALLFGAGAQAHAQGVPSNVLLTPEPGSESTALRLTWTQPSGEIERQILDVRQSGGTWGNDVFFSTLPSGVVASNTLGSGNFLYIDPAVSQTTLSNLSPGTTYEARVRVRNSTGTGAWSGVAQGATLSGDSPGKPQLSARSFSAQVDAMTWRVTLQWSAASNAGTVTKNHLRWRTSAQDPDGTPGNSDDVAAGTWQNAAGDDADCADGAANPENCGEEIAAGTTRYEIAGLAENTDYDFQARQENSIGPGIWSDSLTLTTEGLSYDDSLRSLAIGDALGNVEFSPEFDADILTYNATVRNFAKYVELTPTASDGGASIDVGGNAVDSGAAVRRTMDTSGGTSAQGPAENTFNIEVTAENGDMRIYEIRISRLKAAVDASLSALTLVTGSPVALTPAFDPAVFSYTGSIRNNTSTLTITATANDVTAALEVGRSGALASAQSGMGAAQTITKTSAFEAQDASQNTFQIEVTAEDGSAMQTYEVAISRRQAEDDAALSALSISHGTLFPAFSPGVTSYYAAVGNDVGQLGITPTTRDVAASIQVGRAGHLGGSSVAQGTEVGRGNNVFLVVVTSENSAVTRTYTIDVFRGGAISKLLIHDADENSRTDANSLLPTADFSQTVPAYSLVVQKSVTAVVITTTLTAGAASYQRIRPTVTPASSASLTSGTASSAVPLAGGENLILVKVSTAEYPVTILRPADAPENLAANPKTEKLRVSWDAVAGTTTYRLRWRTKTGPGAWQSASGADDNGEEAGAAPRYTIPGLTNGTTYQVQARADNPAGDGEWSESLEAAPAVAVELPPQDDLAFVAGEVVSVVTLPNAADGATPYVFSLTGMPPGVFFTAATRQISGMPTAPAAPVEVVYSVTDGDSVTDERRFRIGILDSQLNVAEDGADGVNPADGIVIARYLLGVRGAALAEGQSRLEAARLEAAVEAGVRGMKMDVDGDSDVDGDDGILIARHILGLRGAELVSGFSGLTASDVETKVSDLLP
ncbi:MAG: cadherin-like beta sandwich domain-containing protein [Gammaproteobacteria bacterium]|nr:cadherin-like beta sandwich domain-containing protein [Gammaproteobacteria bacterium]